MFRMRLTDLHQDIDHAIEQVAIEGERVVVHDEDGDMMALVPIEDLALIEKRENMDIEDIELYEDTEDIEELDFNSYNR